MLKSIVSVLLVCTLLMVGCTPPNTSQLVTALNAVSDAASVAVVVTSGLVAFGQVDPAVGDQVATYATGVTQAVSTSIAELNSADTNPVKIDVITAAFAKVAAPAIGNVPQVNAVIDAVSAAVKNFLNNLTSTGNLKLAKAAPNVKIVLANGDKAKLQKISQKIVETQAAASQLKVVKK